MIRKLILLAVFTLLVSCGSTKVAYFPTSEVTYNDYNGDILNVRVLGYGTNQQEAIEDAQIRALETLLFRGIPNSSISKPLVGYNETNLKQRNGNYFSEFYGGKRYLTFISESNFIAAENQQVIATKIKKKKTEKGMVKAIVAAVDVLINVKPLRKDLEQNNVIRKFGY